MTLRIGRNCVGQYTLFPMRKPDPELEREGWQWSRGLGRSPGAYFTDDAVLAQATAGRLSLALEYDERFARPQPERGGQS